MDAFKPVRCVNGAYVIKMQFITILKVGMKDFLMYLIFSQNMNVKIHICML